MHVHTIHPGELGPGEIARWHEIQQASPWYGNPFLSPEFAIAVGRHRPDSRVGALMDGHQAAGVRLTALLWCMPMMGDDDRPWTARSRLRDRQYGTDANLAPRQGLYCWQRLRLDLPPLVLDLAGLRGSEMVADVGCGNGAYLTELARRGHAGPVLGMDLSAGMLRAARGRAPAAVLAAGDAAALPLRDAVSDLALAAHMLYHLPEPLDR